MRQVCAHWAWVEESHLDVCMVSISSGEMYLRPMVLNRMSKICGEWAPKLDHSFVTIINRLHVRSIHSVSDVTVYSRAVALPIPSLWWNLFNFSLQKKKKKIKMKKKRNAIDELIAYIMWWNRNWWHSEFGWCDKRFRNAYAWTLTLIHAQTRARHKLEHSIWCMLMNSIEMDACVLVCVFYYRWRNFGSQCSDQPI